MYHPILQKILCFIFRILFALLTRVKVFGLENIPSQGGYILAANHLSVIEVPLLYCLIGRKDLTGLVAKKHQKNPLFRWLVDSMGGIWLNREEADARAIRAARDHLKSGGVLGISPEGTRSPTGALITAKTGVAFLADLAGVPILPVGVAGTWRITRKVLTFRRPVITVNIGQPFRLPPVPREVRAQVLQSHTEEIMSRIAALLPPEYRGVYAEHPRLQEIIQVERFRPIDQHTRT